MHTSALLSTLTVVGSVVASGLHAAVRHEYGGLVKRQIRFCSSVPDTTPDAQLCALSCGANFTQCTDWETCFNPSAGEVCCSNGGG